MDVKKIIRTVPGFPKEGIVFIDVPTILENPEAFRYTVDWFCETFRDAGVEKICAAEARGFMFAAAVAYKMGWPMVPVRKPGKLPAKTISQDYDLEYGSATLHMHEDAVRPGERVLLIDDLLGTGGTAKAMAMLVERLGGIVAGAGFAIELDFLHGRELLKEYRVETLVHYESE